MSAVHCQVGVEAFAGNVAAVIKPAEASIPEFVGDPLLVLDKIMFKKILIANRGEIAVRIIRTCRDMGIKTVALYELSDRASLHVRLADECVPLQTPLGYLDHAAILKIALETGAEAIHPGYGFSGGKHRVHRGLSRGRGGVHRPAAGSDAGSAEQDRGVEPCQGKRPADIGLLGPDV